ncbi:hypothetical protein A2U01_0099190, partial [Trifolium medium]|nr:hypothetical protein [Trifolium medium]
AMLFCFLVLFLELAQRARMLGATRSVRLLRAGCFWFLRGVQGGAALRAGLLVRVDFC